MSAGQQLFALSVGFAVVIGVIDHAVRVALWRREQRRKPGGVVDLNLARAMRLHPARGETPSNVHVLRVR